MKPPIVKGDRVIMSVALPLEVAQALNDFCESLPAKGKRSVVISDATEDYLRRLGYLNGGVANNGKRK